MLRNITILMKVKPGITGIGKIMVKLNVMIVQKGVSDHDTLKELTAPFDAGVLRMAILRMCFEKSVDWSKNRRNRNSRKVGSKVKVQYSYCS